MDLGGDGIKEASKLFMQAGWVFEHLRTLVTGLSPSEITVDFTSEALGMLSNLMLAQAQYLFYRKANEAGMKASILTKIAMQVSEYFKKAYELSQTNQGLK
jgi:programmed cell death 6-interacting protein